jgi:hypothetical protein
MVSCNDRSTFGTLARAKSAKKMEGLANHTQALCDRIAFAENLIPYLHGNIGDSHLNQDDVRSLFDKSSA